MLRRTEKAMIRVMCGTKLMESKSSFALRKMLGVKKKLYA